MLKSGDDEGLGKKVLITVSVGVRDGTIILETICQHLLKYKIHIPFDPVTPFQGIGPMGVGGESTSS